jgi:hypothetical protein
VDAAAGRPPRLLAGLVGLLLVLQVAFGLAPALTRLDSDFANYYVPARALLDRRPLDRLYERDWFQQELRRQGLDGVRWFVPNPPTAVLLAVPVAALPPLPAKAAWTALLALCVAASFLVLRNLLPLSPWWLALAFLVPSASLANSFRYGQPYPLLLLLLCLALRELHRGREVAGGLWLAPVLAMKLYGLAFVPYLAWTRRWRALAGLGAGAGVLVVAGLLTVGLPAHRTWAAEVLPAALAGTVQDRHSTIWGSLSSLSYRLFEHEPDLNPAPVSDRPVLARDLAGGGAVAVLALTVLATRLGSRDQALRREWGAVTLAALVASPLASSYHFVLLVLPVAVLLADGSGAGWRRPALLGLLAFATSPLPHYFAGLAAGWGNLLAYPRLAAVLALLLIALAPLRPRPVLASLGIGLTAGLASVSSRAEDPWTRVAEARGYFFGEPIMCDGGWAWVEIERQGGERFVVRRADGSFLRGAGDVYGPRCVDGRVVAWQNAGGTESPLASDNPRCLPRRESAPAAHTLADVDAAGCGGLVVYADRAAGALLERDGAGAVRSLARGRVRRPRLSPDGGWVVYQAWEGGSWDIRAVERATGRIVKVTEDPANELEPAWAYGGERVVFASDRRRGLGSTALYSVAFRP